VPRSPFNQAPRRPWACATAAGKRGAKPQRAGVQPDCGGSAARLPGGQAGWRPQDMSRPVFPPRSDRFTAWLQNIVPVPARSSRCGGAPARRGRADQRKRAGLQTGWLPNQKRPATKEVLSRRKACPERCLVALGRPATKGRALPPNDGFTAKLRPSPAWVLQTTARPPPPDPWREPKRWLPPNEVFRQRKVCRRAGLPRRRVCQKQACRRPASRRPVCRRESARRATRPRGSPGGAGTFAASTAFCRCFAPLRLPADPLTGRSPLNT